MKGLCLAEPGAGNKFKKRANARAAPNFENATYEGASGWLPDGGGTKDGPRGGAVGCCLIRSSEQRGPKQK